MSFIPLGFSFIAKDNASAVFRRVAFEYDRLARKTQTGSDTMKASMAGVAAGTIGLAAGITSLRAGFGLANIAGKFKQELAATGAIMQATDSQLQMLRTHALDVGLRTPFSPQQIIEGMRRMGELGFDAAKSISMIEPAANLAIGGQISLDAASRATAGTLRAFRMEAQDAAKVTDMLTVAMNNSGFQGPDFERGLSKAAAQMGKYGQSLETTLALLGSIRDLNIDASSAGTALREVARRVYGLKPVQDEINALGVKIYDGDKRRDIADILFDLSERLGPGQVPLSLKDITLNKVTGERGSNAFNALIAKGRDEYNTLLNKLTNAGGKAQERVDKIINTYAGQVTILEGVTQTIATSLGEGFEGALFPVLRGTNSLLSGFAKTLTSIPEPIKKATAAVTLLGASVLTLGAGIVFTTGVIGVAGVILSSFSGIALATTAAAGSLALGIGVIISGIVGLTSVSKSQASGLRPVLETWERVKLVVDGVRQALTGDGGIRGETLFKLVQKENRDLLVIVVNVVRWLDRAQKFAMGMWEGFKIGILENRPILNEFRDAFLDLAKTFGIGDKNAQLMSTTQNEAMRAGAGWGKVISQVAIIGIKGLTMMVKLTNTFIKNIDVIKKDAAALVGILTALTIGKVGKLAMAVFAGGQAASAMAGGGGGLSGALGAADGLGGGSRVYRPNKRMLNRLSRDQQMRLLLEQHDPFSGGGFVTSASDRAKFRRNMRIRGGLGAAAGLGGLGMGIYEGAQGNWGQAAMWGVLGAQGVAAAGGANVVATMGTAAAAIGALVNPLTLIVGGIALTAGVLGGFAYMEKRQREEDRAMLRAHTGEDVYSKRVGKRGGVDTIGAGTSTTGVVSYDTEALAKKHEYRAFVNYITSMGGDPRKIEAQAMYNRLATSGQLSEIVAVQKEAHLQALEEAGRRGVLGANVSVTTSEDGFLKAIAEGENVVKEFAQRSHAYRD